jgi:hypothetical protein
LSDAVILDMLKGAGVSDHRAAQILAEGKAAGAQEYAAAQGPPPAAPSPAGSGGAAATTTATAGNLDQVTRARALTAELEKAYAAGDTALAGKLLQQLKQTLGQ